MDSQCRYMRLKSIPLDAHTPSHTIIKTIYKYSRNVVCTITFFRLTHRSVTVWHYTYIDRWTLYIHTNKSVAKKNIRIVQKINFGPLVYFYALCTHTHKSVGYFFFVRSCQLYHDRNANGLSEHYKYVKQVGTWISFLVSYNFGISFRFSLNVVQS